MRVLIIVASALILTIGLTACSSSTQLKSSDEKLSITVPKDWKESDEDDALISAEKGDRGALVFDVSFMLEELDSARKEAEENDSLVFDGKIDGHEAVIASEENDQALVGLVKVGDTVYMVAVGSDNKDDFDKKEAEKIIKSFKAKK